MASTGRRRFRLPSALATVAVGIVVPIVAGCATVPSGDAPRQVLTGGSAVQAYVRPLPPPGPASREYSTPVQIVLGFLSASASYAFDPGAAKQFLAPALRKTWRPGPVTVVSSPAREENYSYHPRAEGSGPELAYQAVQFTVQHLATLSQNGQYEYSPGTSTYKFYLALIKGVWLITRLPQDGHSLLLTQASFQEVYQPRNLFFFARQQPSLVNGELVPDPVYAPVQGADSAFNTDVAAGLVEGLLNDHGSWLSGATTTAFPRNTKVLDVSISGQTAVVNLGGAAARASKQQKNDMDAQLLATLTSKAYSSPLARNVVLEINGRRQFPGGNSNLVSPVSTGPLVYRSQLGAVSELYPNSTLLPLRQIGPAQVTALAATYNGAGSAAAGSGGGAPFIPAVAIAVRIGSGCTLYLVPVSPAAGQPGGPYHSYPLGNSSGKCTSLSWDRNGNLWAVAGGHIWLLRPQTGRFLPVSSPANLPRDGKSGPRILSLEMAPDGVRAALLVKAPGRNGKRRVWLTAVVNMLVNQRRKVSPGHSSACCSLGTAVPAWPKLPDPAAISWYSAYDLAVLTSNGIWQVPLTGGPGRLLNDAPLGSTSLASDGVSLVVGTAQGTVEVSSAGTSSWKTVQKGSFPSYPS